MKIYSDNIPKVPTEEELKKQKRLRIEYDILMSLQVIILLMILFK